MVDDSDKTLYRPVDRPPETPPVVRPTPGRPPERPTPQQEAPRPTPAGDASIPSYEGQRNRLIDAGTTLFALVGQLSNLTRIPNPTDFHTRVNDEMLRFRGAVERIELDPDTRERASFALCTLIDTSVLNSPLASSAGGEQSVWVHSNMLNLFHEKASGGADFFEFLHAARSAPERNIELLEFLYVALSLGFRGKYGVGRDGAAGDEAALLAERRDTYEAIRRVRGSPNPALSLKWEGLPPLRSKIVEYVPLWVVASVGCALLLALFAVFWWLLSDETDEVYQRLSQVKLEPVTLTNLDPTLLFTARSRAAASPGVDLEALLAEEIRAGRLQLLRGERSVVLRLSGDGLFRSGSWRVNDSYGQVLARVGQALARTSGPILIVGHTDSVRPAIGSPSNLVISRSRAQSVRDAMAPYVGSSQRMEIEGRGASEPLETNDTRAGRKANRRVEIVLGSG